MNIDEIVLAAPNLAASGPEPWISLALPGYAHPSNPYIIKNADGLGPTEVDVSIASTVNQYGVYKRRRPQNREITLTISLNPNPWAGQTVEGLRTALYKCLQPAYDYPLYLRFYNRSGMQCYIEGYCKSFEPNLFSEDPEVQVTFACTTPYLKGGYIWTETAPSLYAGGATITNKGTAPTGFFMEIQFTANVAGFGIHARGMGGSVQMGFYHAFNAGDKLRVETRPGIRGAVRLPWTGGVENLLPYLGSDVTWLQLFGGVNGIDCTQNQFNWLTFQYEPLFLGV